ncbi:MAG: methyltransferase domain-containing protein [Chloroflexi bacterium]|nr:methyltransferase domain-containing protein [Chloroflexota bacterium]
MEVFYRVERAPVHSVLLLDTREEALHYPSGQIHLGLCDHCGFISNVTFDGHLQEYAGRYEATQSYSPTFSAFARSMALDLIARHDLHGKSIIEIGCGQGEFLLELCELGGNSGIGFDPAYRGEPIASEARDRVQFVADLYSEKYRAYRGDFICCKMTLEHISNTFEFMSNVRQSIADNPDCVVFFQVPNAEYVLRDTAFWDVYYEHCSYFTASSLTYLFERSGFVVERTYTVYDDQYLVVEARPAVSEAGPVLPPEAHAQTRALVMHFVTEVENLRNQWKDKIEGLAAEGKQVVLWGGGSKGVAFLTTLGLHHQIQHVVDINPKKMGKFMATTGQEIVQPEFLKALQPDTVIVMNPIYCREIGAMLEEMNIKTSMLSL